jgi:hypothetical protein
MQYNRDPRRTGIKVLEKLATIYPDSNPLKWTKAADLQNIIDTWGGAISSCARDDIVTKALEKIARDAKVCPKSPAEIISICRDIIRSSSGFFGKNPPEGQKEPNLSDVTFPCYCPYCLTYFNSPKAVCEGCGWAIVAAKCFPGNDVYISMRRQCAESYKKAVTNMLGEMVRNRLFFEIAIAFIAHKSRNPFLNTIAHKIMSNSL